MSIIRVIKKFRQILSRHQKIRILELAVLMVIGGFLEMLSVSLMLPFMTTVMEPESVMGNRYVRMVCDLLDLQIASTFLVVFSAALALIYVAKNAYLLFEMGVQNRFVYGNMFATQSRLLETFIHRPYEFFLGISSGEILRIINRDTADTFNLLTTILQLFTELVVSSMVIAAILIMSPQITLLIAGLMLGLLLVINTILKPILRKAGLENQEAGAGTGKWLLQSIQGVKELKVMQKEQFFLDNYNAYGLRSVQAQRKSAVLGNTPRFLIEGVSMAATFLAIAIMLYRGAAFEKIVPALSTVAVAAIRLLPSVNRISGALTQISYCEPMLDKTIETLQGMDEWHASPVESDASGRERKITALKRELSLVDISYHYPDSDVNVLEKAGLSVKRGESVGIVGASGAGKTTAVDVILGLLCPQGGQVLVDGVDIREDYPGWLDLIGYIPQTIFMLDDSIRANVAFGEAAEDIDDEKVWTALREASLEEFVRSLPNGLDTQIGERGVRLSGGQRQRLGIARALYEDPGVLIFDEATSALDNETEAEIMESINHLHGQRTMLIIAHRLTTIEACDHVYRVEGGKITKER